MLERERERERDLTFIKRDTKYKIIEN